jgi:hypothetical protein
MKMVLAVLLAMSASAIVPSVDLQPPKVRSVENWRGEPIETLILPEDEVVLLKLTGDVAIATGRPSVGSLLKSLRRQADLIVVAEVDNMTAHENNAHNWIETQLDVYVHEFVFKSPRLTSVSDNQKQQISVPGGELFIGNTLVKAEGTPSLKIGGVYLFFMAVPGYGAPFLRWVYPPLLVEGGTLVSNRADFSPHTWDADYHDPLGGQALSTIVKLLKKP